MLGEDPHERKYLKNNEAEYQQRKQNDRVNAQRPLPISDGGDQCQCSAYESYGETGPSAQWQDTPGERERD